MVKIVTTCSVGYGVPILDSKGEPVKSRVKFGGREVEIEEQEQVRVDADTVIDVDKAFARELIDAGYARTYDEALDEDAEEVDPTSNASAGGTGDDPLA